jgi:hypothetical protein
MLFEQEDRRAASRADCTAGSSKPTSVPMMAITTSSSTSVKPRRFELKFESVIENTFRPCGPFYEEMKNRLGNERSEMTPGPTEKE